MIPSAKRGEFVHLTGTSKLGVSLIGEAHLTEVPLVDMAVTGNLLLTVPVVELLQVASVGKTLLGWG